jgi:hypothetical protein
MAETIQLVDYFYIEAPDKPGEGARVLALFKGAGVNLLAFSGFPKGRRAQLDFIPADPAAFKAAAKKNKLKLVGPKKGFLIQGDDRVGALADLLAKLAGAKINVTATDAVCAGAGRYGVLLWVKPRDVKRAAKAFGIAQAATPRPADQPPTPPAPPIIPRM